MKIAIFSESPENEEAIRIIVECLLGKTTETAGLPSLQARSWPGVKGSVTAVLRELHYSTDAEAFVVVADSDDSPVHHNNHDSSAERISNADCVICVMRLVAPEVNSKRKPVMGR